MGVRAGSKQEGKQRYLTHDRRGSSERRLKTELPKGTERGERFFPSYMTQVEVQGAFGAERLEQAKKGWF